MSAGTVFTLEDAASSVEAMAASWYKDLVDGTAAASGLSPRLRATLAFVTQEPAVERGQQVLRLIRERQEEQQRQDEAARQRAIAAQQTMVKELRRLKGKSTGPGPLTAATIADALSNNWDLFVDFFREQSVGLFGWLEETGEPNVSERVRRAMASGEQPPRPERLMAAFYVAFSSEPKPWYRGRPVDRASLAKLARSVVSHGPDSGDDEDGQFLTSLLESGVLTTFARLEGHDNLAIVESQWRLWVDEWLSTKPPTDSRSQIWGRAVLLHAATDEDARATLSGKAHKATTFRDVLGVPKRLSDRAGKSPGIDAAIVGKERQARHTLTDALTSSLRAAGLLTNKTKVVVTADLGVALAADLDAALAWIAVPSNVDLVRKYLKAQSASNLALEAWDRLTLNAESSVTSRNDSGLADALLFELTAVLCPNETPKFDGRRVEAEALVNYAFGSPNWLPVRQAIRAIPQSGMTHTSHFAATRLFKSHILTRDGVANEGSQTKTIASEWQLAYDEFRRLVARVAQVSGHPLIHRVSSEQSQDLVLGVLLTAVTDANVRGKLATAAQTAYAQFRKSHRDWFTGMEAAGMSVGMDLAIVVLGEFANTMPMSVKPSQATAEYTTHWALWWVLGVIALTTILIVVVPIMTIMWLLLGLAGVCCYPLIADWFD